MSEYAIQGATLTGIADAIRAKLGAQTTYNPGQMAAAIAAIPTGTTPTGTINITKNGTTDVTNYASANVNVPNTYAAGDEGKVVSNGALVSQTARATEITANGTYDTTYNNSVPVNVGGSADPGLPSGYQELEYIEFIAPAGYAVTIPTTGLIEVSATPTVAVSGTTDQCVIGYRVGGSNTKDFELRFKSSKLYGFVRESDFGGTVVSAAASKGTKVKGIIAVDGIRSSAFIGRYADYSSAAYFGFTGYIHYVRITDAITGALIMKFVPCRETSDDSFGFYEVVNGTYYNIPNTTGDGSVSAGPDVA